MARKLKPVHPGEILREEFLKPLGLSMNRLAMDLHVPVTRIAEIVNERRGITADTALRLGRYFKNSAEFCMNIAKALRARSCQRRDSGGMTARAVE
jgi:addiction module HigA family antidote